jgi:hypothetical protein
VQSAMDQLFGAHLRRRGKRRWCDKSLDTYAFAGLVAQAYPKAKFICLYRHCMDVIASGVEACPLGQGQSEVARCSYVVTIDSGRQRRIVAAAGPHFPPVTISRLFPNILANNGRWPSPFLDHCCRQTRQVQKRRPSDAIVPFSGA